jgi:hypothetical protein
MVISPFEKGGLRGISKSTLALLYKRRVKMNFVIQGILYRWV